MNNLLKKISQHKLFLILFVLAAVIRLVYVSNNVVPFMFDHGKDALAILHMIVVPKLKLIGPWTSIPGLYFGPGWYYLLAPFSLIFQYNPTSFAYTMIILVLFQMYLVYKYFNIESAAIIGFSGFWVMISRSAWNPYPMTLLTIIILILLSKQIELKKLSNKYLAGLFLVASFGFHFSSAFAIFYPVIIVLLLLLYRFKPTAKNLLVAVGSFIIPFIPQIIFEVRNNFPQTKAIRDYFTKGEAHEFGLEKIKDVLQVTFGEFRIISFESTGNYDNILKYLLIIFVIVSLVFIVRKKKLDRDLKDLLPISMVFLIIPILGFLFLHFNLWYVYPMIPVVTILLGTIVSKMPKRLSLLFVIIYVLTSLSRLNFYVNEEKDKFLLDRVHYPVKEKIIDYIRKDADGKNFSVYTYMPDIYDFPFQYVFLTQGLKGEELPMEFAYEPGVPSYVREKEDILAVIDKKYGQRWRGEPKVVYYIVTDKAESDLLLNWWGRQKYGEIIAEKDFGDDVIVYTATPEVQP